MRQSPCCIPEMPITDRTRSGPYSSTELASALTWITGRAADPAGLAAWALREHPPPPAQTHRILYQRPELAEAWHWARTSDDLAAEPELDLWLSDSLDEKTSVGLIVRDAMPQDPADAAELVRDLPPTSWETFPVPYQTARSIVPDLLQAADKPLVRVRGKTSRRCACGRAPTGPACPTSGPATSSSSTARRRSSPGPPKACPVPRSPFRPSPKTTRKDWRPAVGQRPGTFCTNRGRAWRQGNLVLRLEWADGHDQIGGLSSDVARRILSEYADGVEERTERDRRDNLARLLRTWPRSQVTEDVVETLDTVACLLREAVKHSDVVLRVDDERARVVVTDRRRAASDEDLRQVFTPRDPERGPVLLEDHQADVADRAGALAGRLGLPSSLTAALRLAGRHHDDGKADRRFQSVRLGAESGGPLLAKSDPRSTVRQVRERQAQAGLPSRWRHEQRSVPDSWEALHVSPGVDPLLAARLIGTSHGHGRSGFPHTAEQLAARDEPRDWLARATDLFDHGGWDKIIETTHIRYGVWGCAYLEALLRAADSQVSGESR